MDIRKLILSTLNRKGKVKSAEIIKATGFSRAYINRFFQTLRNEGKIILLGKANNAHYVKADQKNLARAKKKINKINRVLHNKGLFEDIVLKEIKDVSGIFTGLPDNIGHVLEYAFTEMLNNAIEHSQTDDIAISMHKDKELINFTVFDRGVGIFNNIIKKKKLGNIMEAIHDLLKGKQTTLPQAHSGEGIFFTSKVADMLVIQSSNKKLIFNNIVDDVFIRDIKKMTGTKVVFTIKLDSRVILRDVFGEYTDESFEFSKTKVNIKLYKKGVNYISRSQARRILSGLENFKTISFDFRNVDSVGQGFADEIFRVWQRRYPKKKLIVLNANENISFMVHRAQE